jgi:cobalt/nickel transport system ATP-binding protein
VGGRDVVAGRGGRRDGVVVDDAMTPAPDAGPVAEPSLRVVDLAFAYPDGNRALDGVDLVVGRGERVALLGPNGAGKTTLVLHLNGVLQPERGSVTVAGLTVAKPSLREIRRRVGIVFQDPDDQLFMPTVRDDVAFGPANLGLRGPELDARVEHALALVGMQAYADRPPNHLSYGQRRRVAVATVLAMEPEVLVLDEPSSNLDPASRRELAEILGGLDVTLLMVTHDLPYALELCPRSLVINEGRIVADGPTVEVLSDDALMRANRLELPFGFDPRWAVRHAGDGAGR